MGAKSIIDIDVNDRAFRDFQKVYERYQAGLKTLPAAWGEAGKKIDGSKKSFDAMVTSMIAANVQAKLQAKAQEVADRASQSMAQNWRDVARSTKQVADNIGHATLNLLRWTSLTGLVSGVLGFGGLFGLERLAAGVSGSRRASGGLGVSIGEEKAFALNVGRFVDPSSVLAGVNAGKTDVTSPAYLALRNAGLSAEAIKSQSVFELSLSALRGAVGRISKLPEGQRGAAIDYLHFGALGIDIGAVQRYLRNPTEFQEQTRRAGHDAGALNLSDPMALAWDNFKRQLTLSGETIETVIIGKLTPLTKPLEHLSSAFELTVTKFLNAKGIGEWIDTVAAGLKKWAEVMREEDFQKKVKDMADAFVDAINKFIDAAKTVTDFLSIFRSTSSAEHAAKVAEGKRTGLIARAAAGQSQVATPGEIGSRFGKEFVAPVAMTTAKGIRSAASYLSDMFVGGPMTPMLTDDQVRVFSGEVARGMATAQRTGIGTNRIPEDKYTAWQHGRAAAVTIYDRTGGSVNVNAASLAY
jgi:hypothetical protein